MMISRRKMVGLGLAAAATSVATGAISPLQAQHSETHPIVVELFTSQGCYSCPPADAYLGELVKRQDVIGLAFHVDYWDYIGWPDPFASPHHTQRQRTYGRVMDLRTIYTPQMVIDGVLDRVGSRRHQVAEALALRASASPVERISVPVTLGKAGVRTVEIDIPKASLPNDADVWFISYTDEHLTHVKRGENANKTLSEFNIVRSYYRVGEYKGQALRGTIENDLIHEEADGVVVLLQAKNQGPIWGAAELRL